MTTIKLIIPDESVSVGVVGIQTQSQTFISPVEDVDSTKVKLIVPDESVSVGIQTQIGPQTFISKLEDVDSTNLENGSVLVYKTASGKWTATTTLDLQNIEGGEY